MERNAICMPKVGDHLMHVMTAGAFHGLGEEEDCIVIHTNPNHRHYTVQFMSTGIRETFKLPAVDEIAAFKRDFRRAFGREPSGVYVFESGILYETLADCAKALGVPQCTIISHFRGDLATINGYHIYHFM